MLFDEKVQINSVSETMFALSPTVELKHPIMCQLTLYIQCTWFMVMDSLSVHASINNTILINTIFFYTSMHYSI